MQRHRLLRTHRQPDYNYSTPEFYHLLLETENKANILATEKNGIVTLREAGRIFLDTVGQALQHFPCLCIHAMAIRPSAVEILLEITHWRNQSEEPERGTAEWIQWRRTMTLSVFVGYLKMNSGMQINVHTRSTGSVWTRRYRERVVTEIEDRETLQSELSEEWERVVIPSATLKKKKSDMSNTFAAALHNEFGIDSAVNKDLFSSELSSGEWREMMILGRVQLLTGVRRTGLQPADAGVLQKRKKTSTGGKRRRRVSVIRSLGPGLLFLSG